MRKKGYSEKIINTIKLLYSQTYIQIGSERVKIKKGVVQGGLLSPKLFNLFYDTLIDKLDNLGIFITAYADDVTILTESNPKLTEAIKEVKN